MHTQRLLIKPQSTPFPCASWTSTKVEIACVCVLFHTFVLITHLGQTEAGTDDELDGDADAKVVAASTDVVIDDLEEAVEESFIPVKWSAKEDDNPEEIQKIMIHQVGLRSSNTLPLSIAVRFDFSNHVCRCW